MTFKPLTEAEAEILSRVALVTNRWAMATAGPEEFTVDYQTLGNYTICILERKLTQRSMGYFIGVAKFNPTDPVFRLAGGRRLALRRAFERVGHVPPLRCKP